MTKSKFLSVSDGIARRQLVFGLTAAPEVVLNGEPLAQPPQREQIDGRDAYSIPLVVETR